LRVFILSQVPLPNPDERVAILAKHVRNMPLAADIDISRIGRDCRMQGFSGADVAGLCREAAMFCIKGNLGSDAIDSALVRVWLQLLLARALLTAASGDNAAF
jgi:SpoVK/Ycf46/Vps4 family AAA+-type ATPase